MTIAVIILVILAYLFIGGLLKAKSKVRKDFFDKWEDTHNGEQ